MTALARREDRLGRAVVLLELDHGGVGEVLLELEDVADVGAAEAVDRLRIVADDRQVPVLPAQQLQQPVLGAVRVLVLVHQDPAEALLVALADVLEELEHVDRPHQQVVEVHRVGLEQALLVGAVGLGDHRLERRDGLLGVGLGVHQQVLEVRDPGLDRARRVALGVDLEVGEAALDHPQRVGLVVDREALLVAEALGLDPQQAGAGGVEGHHPHPLLDPADQLGDALAHLLRGLVGEGDREDLVRARLAGGEQVGDPVGQHPRLARPGAREHEQRPLAVGDGLALGRVQPLGEALDGVAAGIDGGAGRERLLEGVFAPRSALNFVVAGPRRAPRAEDNPGPGALRLG